MRLEVMCPPSEGKVRCPLVDGVVVPDCCEHPHTGVLLGHEDFKEFGLWWCAQ